MLKTKHSKLNTFLHFCLRKDCKQKGLIGEENGIILVEFDSHVL